MAIALDIETTGLSPWEDDIVAIGISTDGAEAVAYTPWDEAWDDMPDFLRDAFESHDLVIAHNAAFDLVWLKVKYGIEIPEMIWDTMIAEALLKAGLADSVSLAEVMLRRFGEVMDKTLQTSFTLDERPSREQLDYLEKDVQHLFDIYQQQHEEIIYENLEEVWWGIEQPVTTVFCDMIYEGVKLNVPKLSLLIEREKAVMEKMLFEVSTELSPVIRHERIKIFDEKMKTYKRYEAKVKELEEEHYARWQNLMQLAEFERGGWEEEWSNVEAGSPREKGANKFIRYQMKKWKAKNPKPPKPKLDEGDINLGSPQQVLAAFRELGVPLENTREAALKAALPKAPKDAQQLITSLLKYKKSAKLVQAFGDSLMKWVDADSKLHSHFRQYGTETGRPTSVEPNLLQMPNSPEYRDCFEPDEDEVMIVCDYSQMELREMAQLSGDRNMIRAFTDGLDLHQNTAALMYNVPYEEVTEKQRKLAKTVNFGTLYGMGPNKLQATMAVDGVYMTMDEAKEALDRWKKAYPEAAKAIVLWGQDAVQDGFTQTAFGRRRRFRVVRGMSRAELGRISRQGANHVIQGTNADITKMAMVMIHRMIKPIGGKVRLQIYDEIVVTVPRKHMHEGATIVQACMKAAAEEVLTKVPAVVDCVISTSWSEKSAIAG